MVNCVANDFKGEGSVIYYSGEGSSPALDWYAEQTGKDWQLTVDYRQVLEFRYYGTSEPPERDLSLQVMDWQAGYMWGRFQVNQYCEKDPNGGYYYLVKYAATLEEVTVPPVPPVPDEMKYIIAAILIGGVALMAYNSLKKEV